MSSAYVSQLLISATFISPLHSIGAYGFLHLVGGLIRPACSCLSDPAPLQMCRFRKAATRRRFGLCKAIGWNFEVLNRMECAAGIGVPVEAA